MVARLIGIVLGLIIAYAVTKTFINPDFDVSTWLASFGQR